jgi:hypothetical protein
MVLRSLRRHSHAPHGTDRWLWAHIPEVGVERKVCGVWDDRSLLSSAGVLRDSACDEIILTYLPNLHASALLSTTIFASTPKTSFASPIPHNPRPECHGRCGVPVKHARQQTSRNPYLSHASVCLSCPVRHMHGYQECVIELARGPYSVLGGSNDCTKRLGRSNSKDQYRILQMQSSRAFACGRL